MRHFLFLLFAAFLWVAAGSSIFDEVLTVQAVPEGIGNDNTIASGTATLSPKNVKPDPLHGFVPVINPVTGQLDAAYPEDIKPRADSKLPELAPLVPNSSGTGKVSPADCDGANPIALPNVQESTPTQTQPPITAQSVPNLAPKGGPISQATNNIIPVFGSVTQTVATAQGNELVDAAKQVQWATREAAAEDQQVLSAPYRKMPFESFANSLERAQQSLHDVGAALQNCSGSNLDASECARFSRAYMNAEDKTALALDSIHEEQQKQRTLGSISPFTGFLGPADANPLARTSELADIFGGKLTSDQAVTPDGLINRLVMFHGLPSDQQKAIEQKLKLMDSPTVTFPNGEVKSVALLHNGYIFGATGGLKDGGALDCSSFVSSLLPPDLRKGRLTTLDLREMWFYRRRGYFPDPPKYPPSRLKALKETAQAFQAMDLYTGETPTVGDLLVYRLAWSPVGHVFIVTSYNADQMRAGVIEAAQSAGTIRERDLNLSTDPEKWPRRRVRPGLMVLRLKPVNNSACQYHDPKKGRQL